TPAAADHLLFGVQPTTTVAGVSIAPAFTVRVVDAFDNLVNGSSASVTIGINTNAGGGALGGTLNRNASGGVATFDDVSINKTGNGYTLAATDGSLVGATSSAFNITPALAHHLAVGVQPSDAIAGQFIAPPITVRVLDAFGNLVTGDSSFVTVLIQNNPGSGTLSGATVVAASGGIATFSDLSINKTGVGYALKAIDGGLGSALS